MTFDEVEGHECAICAAYGVQHSPDATERIAWDPERDGLPERAVYACASCAEARAGGEPDDWPPAVRTINISSENLEDLRFDTVALLRQFRTRKKASEAAKSLGWCSSDVLRVYGKFSGYFWVVADGHLNAIAREEPDERDPDGPLGREDDMKKLESFHVTNLGRYGDACRPDLDGYVHLTAEAVMRGRWSVDPIWGEAEEIAQTNREASARYREMVRRLRELGVADVVKTRR